MLNPPKSGGLTNIKENILQIKKLNLIYFSPTLTTEKTLRNIIENIDIENITEINLTKQEIRNNIFEFAPDELVVIGMPVYGGRIPVIFENYKKLIGDNTPVVCVVVYGNREYEDALLELAKLCKSSGFKVVAAAAFIAEHNLNSNIAPGRPDEKDIVNQKDFGANIVEKFKHFKSINETRELNIKGNFPYRSRSSFPLAPQPYENCIKCGVCATECPVQVIKYSDFKVSDIQECLMCFRCVKLCPNQARGIDKSIINSFNEKLKKIEKMCATRKNPEIFI